MNVLIVGGCGFVGANLATMFEDDGYKVRCVDNLSRKGANINLGRITAPTFVGGVKEFFQQSGFIRWEPDIILNCSAQSRSMAGIEDPSADFYGNVETTFYCLELARKYDCPIIHWSTNKVYGEKEVNRINLIEGETRFNVDDAFEPPTIPLKDEGARTVYGATKLAAENLIDEWSRLYGIPCIRNRFSCLAGPHQYGCSDQGWVALWMINHFLNKPLKYLGWNGKQVRDVLHVDDLYQLIKIQASYLMAGHSETVNDIYNVGGGVSNSLSLRECTAICERLTGNDLNIQVDPEPRWADQRVYVSDITKVTEKFGWEPTKSPAETLTDIHAWLEEDEAVIRGFYL